jgi:hypothetical protein
MHFVRVFRRPIAVTIPNWVIFGTVATQVKHDLANHKQVIEQVNLPRCEHWAEHRRDVESSRPARKARPT